MPSWSGLTGPAPSGPCRRARPGSHGPSPFAPTGPSCRCAPPVALPPVREWSFPPLIHGRDVGGRSRKHRSRGGHRERPHRVHIVPDDLGHHGNRVHVLAVRPEADRVRAEVVRVAERDLHLRESLADPLPLGAAGALQHVPDDPGSRVVQRAVSIHRKPAAALEPVAHAPDVDTGQPDVVPPPKRPQAVLPGVPETSHEVLAPRSEQRDVANQRLHCMGLAGQRLVDPHGVLDEGRLHHDLGRSIDQPRHGSVEVRRRLRIVDERHDPEAPRLRLAPECVGTRPTEPRVLEEDAGGPEPLARASDHVIEELAGRPCIRAVRRNQPEYVPEPPLRDLVPQRLGVEERGPQAVRLEARGHGHRAVPGAQDHHGAPPHHPVGLGGAALRRRLVVAELETEASPAQAGDPPRRVDLLDAEPEALDRVAPQRPVGAGQRIHGPDDHVLRRTCHHASSVPGTIRRIPPRREPVTCRATR